MRETLYPLDLPPGYKHTGTALQARDRWYAGNCVRFYQGTIQPIGGWVARTTTGATISGTPNAAHSWTLNDGTSYLAIGTTTHLYVVSSANVVYDITPPVADSQPFTWQLTNFGAYLMAVNVVSGYTGNGNIWQWTGNVGTAATAAVNPSTGFSIVPPSSAGVVVTPERFLVLLRGSDAAGSPSPGAAVIN